MKNEVWNERPFEIKNLFNPSFCGVLLLRAMEGYQAEDNLGMPFSLSFLILPLCLQKESREIFLTYRKRYLLKTLAHNPQLLVKFPERCTSLIPQLFEGLGFTMQYGSFEVTNSGKLLLVDKGIKKKLYGSQESIECQKVAQILGKNFAKIGDRATIYTSFGVKP